jgi:hypothetical protein
MILTISITILLYTIVGGINTSLNSPYRIEKKYLSFLKEQVCIENIFRIVLILFNNLVSCITN